MGWVGILSTIPVVTVCRWHRTLLFLAGATQCVAPLVRYLGATSVPVALGTQFLMGAASGVISAWPAMLARLQVGTQTQSAGFCADANCGPCGPHIECRDLQRRGTNAIRPPTDSTP